MSHLLLVHFTAEAWPLVVEETKLSDRLETRQAADPAPLQWREEGLDIGVDGAPRGGGAAGVGVGYERVSPFGRRRRDSERRKFGGQGGAWKVHERRRAQRFRGIGQIGTVSRGENRRRGQRRTGGRELRVSLCVRGMHSGVAAPIKLGEKTVNVVDAPVVPAL